MKQQLNVMIDDVDLDLLTLLEREPGLEPVEIAKQMELQVRVVRKKLRRFEDVGLITILDKLVAQKYVQMRTFKVEKKWRKQIEII